jgi:hypothetical protein
MIKLKTTVFLLSPSQSGSLPGVVIYAEGFQHTMRVITKRHCSSGVRWQSRVMPRAMELAIQGSLGEFVIQDYTEVANWYRSSRARYAPAQRNLGNVYENGEGDQIMLRRLVTGTVWQLNRGGSSTSSATCTRTARCDSDWAPRRRTGKAAEQGNAMAHATSRHTYAANGDGRIQGLCWRRVLVP